MAPAPSDRPAQAALDNERRFVLALGGFALEIAGATLVTHERLPAPGFNFVVVGAVAPERQAAFFERCLDHYFQRAIRPTFRLPRPVPPHLDRGLRELGLRPRADLLEVMIHRSRARPAVAFRFQPRRARREDLDALAAFWTTERERPEFRTALDVAWSHPNPGEEIVPILAGSQPAAAALVYRNGTTAGIYAVSTRPGARGQGAASELVGFARAGGVIPAGAQMSILADSPRLKARLERLGFETAESLQEYHLSPDAELAIPPPGPAGPPRWRPPRGRG